MSDIDPCPRCNSTPETLEHVFRDCEEVAELWDKFVSMELWSRFFSIGFDPWLKSNLFSMDYGSGQWNWSMLFGVMVNTIWQERNHLVFEGVRSSLDSSLATLLRQVEFIHGETFKSAASLVEVNKQVMHIKWIPPPHNAFKLNTDGSHKQGSHFSACGGLIRNHSGNFIVGFHCNLGV